MMREQAWRLFAGEYNETTCKLEGEGDKDPSYVVSPLGAKVNRLYVVGVLTNVEDLSNEGEMLRAHVSDPTGVFFIYAGQYQPEILDTLAHMDTPSYVALVGKSRTYEPEEGTIYVSVRPELIKEVDASLRDYWILESCRHTKKRIEAVVEAGNMSSPSVDELRRLGYDTALAEGVIASLSHYGPIDIDSYYALIKEALTSLKTGDITTSPQIQDIEGQILDLISKNEGDEGIPWEKLVKKGIEEKFEKEIIETTLESLMDKGLIYEPQLGKLKTA
jgi:RPA family protein